MKKSWIVGTVAVAWVGVARANVDPLEAIAVQQAKQQAPDATQVGTFLNGSGEKTDFQVLLEANQCYWFSGASEGVIKLYLYLWEPNAKFFTPRVADAKAPGGSVSLAYCTTKAGMYKFQVKTEGRGHYVVGVYGKAAPKQPDPPPAAVVTPSDKPIVNLGPICDKTAKASASGAKLVGDFFKGEGSSIGSDDRADYTVMMESGKCYWVIACGEPDHVKSLSLYLWGPNGKRITEAKGSNANPMIGHCSKETGMYKMQTKVTGGKGAFNVGVYAK